MTRPLRGISMLLLVLAACGPAEPPQAEAEAQPTPPAADAPAPATGPPGPAPDELLARLDCEAPDGEIAAYICADPELTRLNRRLHFLWTAVMRADDALSEEELDRARARQREWFEVRDACGRDRACLEEAYERRDAELRAELEARR